MVAFDVLGEPKAQPRAKARCCGGFVMIYTPATAKQWKGLVAEAAKPFLRQHGKLSGPLELSLTFRFSRPKSHFTSKGALTKNAPTHFTKKPDTDNLCKAVMDALTDLGLWDDDSQVVTTHVSKSYAEPQGCAVTIQTVP